jgi:hypothetical protein
VISGIISIKGFALEIINRSTISGVCILRGNREIKQVPTVSSSFHFDMSTVSQPSMEQPAKEGLLHKMKTLFSGIKNKPAIAPAREEEAPPRIMTPEELELEHFLTFFTDIMQELSPYSANLKEKLKESNESLVEISPVFISERLNLLSAEFFDGMFWSIWYTQEKKCESLKEYLSSLQSPTLETVVETNEMETNDGSQYSQPEYQSPEDNIAELTTEPNVASLSTAVPTTQSPTAAESPTTPTSESPAFFALLPRVLIQPRLKEITSLACIPTIHYTQIPLDPADDLNWIIEDDPPGVPVRLAATSPLRPGKSDRLEICVDGKWTRLRRRMKERFLDDLARIQVAYSIITSEHLGPLVPMQVTNERSGMFNRLKLTESFIIADIEPTFPTPKEYILSHSQDSFTSHLLSKATESMTTFTSGPYPLSLPDDILSNVLVHPITGNITRLSHCWNTGTIPWELACLAPLQLSPPARKRYNYSLKRHYFGALVRNRGCNPDAPKVYEVAVAEGREVWECICGVGREGGVERMVNVVLGKRDWEGEKRKWEEGIII